MPFGVARSAVVSVFGRIVAEGRSAIPPQFLVDMTVSRALAREDFEIGEEFYGSHDGLDAFDNDDALYVIVFDKRDETYLGSARLISTTRPHLLRNAAPFLLEFGKTVEGPSIWELSRLCAMSNRRTDAGREHSIDLVAGELLDAAVEVAHRAGVTQIVYVASDSTFDILERIGCAPRLMPRPAIGASWGPHVVLLDVGKIPLQRIRKTTRIKGEVVAFGRRPAEQQ